MVNEINLHTCVKVNENNQSTCVNIDEVNLRNLCKGK